jgi:hypothetical protein
MAFKAIYPAKRKAEKRGNTGGGRRRSRSRRRGGRNRSRSRSRD